MSGPTNMSGQKRTHQEDLAKHNKKARTEKHNQSKKPRFCGLTVGELKACLSKFDDNLPLVYAGDEEGNDYHLLFSKPSLADMVQPQEDDDRAEITDEGVNTIKCVIIN